MLLETTVFFANVMGWKQSQTTFIIFFRYSGIGLGTHLFDKVP